MKNRKRTLSPPQIGLSLILVIFIVLCLVIFATLSLVTALQEERHAQKVADNVAEYYQADNEANKILSEIDSIITTLASDVTPETVSEELASIEGISATYPAVSYQVPISDKKELQVELELKDSSVDNGSYDYTITKWKEVYIGDFKGDDSLPLLKVD